MVPTINGASLTCSELLWLLGYHPVSCLNIDKLECWEELADNWQGFVGYILAVCATDEERWPGIAHLIWVLEGEVAQMVERGAQDLERDLELLCLLVRRPMQVTKKELADGDRL
jgi:hypothetical protein